MARSPMNERNQILDVRQTHRNSFKVIDSDFDRSQLFKSKKLKYYQQGKFSHVRRSGGRFISRGPKGQSGGAQREKLINFEMLDDSKMVVSFQGFFDTEIKEKIESVPNATYDHKNQVWIVPLE